MSNMTSIETIIDFLEYGFRRLDYSLQGLAEDELDWQSCSEANTLRNILTHIIGEWYERDARIVAGNKNMVNDSLPDSLKNGTVLSLDEIIGLLDGGKRFLRSEFNSLTDIDLDYEIDWFLGNRTRGYYLIHCIGELLHHEGQIAAIRGLKKRISN
jgi:hypothetical protein